MREGSEARGDTPSPSGAQRRQGRAELTDNDRFRSTTPQPPPAHPPPQPPGGRTPGSRWASLRGFAHGRPAEGPRLPQRQHRGGRASLSAAAGRGLRSTTPARPQAPSRAAGKRPRRSGAGPGRPVGRCPAGRRLAAARRQARPQHRQELPPGAMGC